MNGVPFHLPIAEFLFRIGYLEDAIMILIQLRERKSFSKVFLKSVYRLSAEVILLHGKDIQLGYSLLEKSIRYKKVKLDYLLKANYLAISGEKDLALFEMQSFQRLFGKKYSRKKARYWKTVEVNFFIGNYYFILNDYSNAIPYFEKVSASRFNSYLRKLSRDRIESMKTM